MAAPSRVCSSCSASIPHDTPSCPTCGAVSLPAATEAFGAGIGRRLAVALGERYRLEAELGEGGMAVVFLAYDGKHQRRVAVKVLRPDIAAFLGGERFEREIQIAAQLNHPHILALHDSGGAEGLLYYVMPYWEGESLRQRLQREGQLSCAEALRIATEVADGLAYAHEMGFVHRDIKPENILLSHSHAAIADFGIARVMAGAGATYSTTGITLGTSLYMSPEQSEPGSALDHRTDIYALGCVVYEMLAGAPPFQGPNPQAIMALHAVEPVPDVRLRRPDVAAQVAAAIRRAMAKSPAERFATAAEFRDTLAAARSTSPLPGWLVRALATVRSHRAATAGAAALSVVALAAYFIMRHGPPPPQVSLSVAVPYFRDLSGGRLRATADRLTEALTDRLHVVPSLAVTASDMLGPYHDAAPDAILKRFPVDRLVFGDVEAQGESVRVAVRIVEPASGRQLPDNAVDPVSGRALPSRIVAAVASRPALDSLADGLSGFVRTAFWRDLEAQGRRGRVRGAEAWTLVQQADVEAGGAFPAVLRRADREAFHALLRADSLLRLAGQRDHNSSLIPIERARLLDRKAFIDEFLAQSGLDTSRTADAIRSRRDALGQLDAVVRRWPTQADAFELRATVLEGLQRLTGEDSLRDDAIAEIERATALNPDGASAWWRLGQLRHEAGRFAEALIATDRALRVDAFQLYRRDLLRARFEELLDLEQYAGAEEACRAGRREAPSDRRFADCELQLWSRSRGDRPTAARAMAVAESLSADEPFPLWRARRALWVAAILARAGLRDSADHVAARATAGTDVTHTSVLLEQAYVRRLRGDADSAAVLLNRAIRLDAGLRRYIQAAPRFNR